MMVSILISIWLFLFGICISIYVNQSERENEEYKNYRIPFGIKIFCLLNLKVKFADKKIIYSTFPLEKLV